MMQQDPLRMETTAGPTGTATEETDRLIASNKVDGTAVYDRQGERLGSIYNFMVDKHRAKSSTLPCRLVVFSASATATTPCPGRR